MSTFGITDESQVVDAVNYLLVNLGSGNGTGNVGNAVTINTTTGQVSQGGTLLSYYYQYLYVRYATNSSGTTGFSTSPTNATYFGVFNNASGTLYPASSLLTNPANYQWTQVSGGFSTNKFLWYSTIGGQQISFDIATTAKNSNYVQAPTGTPINLQQVTAATTLPIVVLNTYQRSNTAPSTPTGGTYNFSTLQFLAPSGWSNSIPAGNSAFYSSQNTFQADAAGNVVVGPNGPWTTPVLTGQNGNNGSNGANGANGVNGYSTYLYNVFQSANATPGTPTGGSYNFSTAVGIPPTGWLNYPTSTGNNAVYVTTASVQTTTPNVTVTGLTWSSPTQYTGGNGTPGPRGFIPMGYVLTPTTPVGASDANLTTWFQSPRTNTTAPIGTGYVPVDGDVAAFTLTGNPNVVVVNQFTASTQTWAAAPGQVVNGNVFVTGSINSNKLAANDIYTLKLQSTNATFGSPTGFGFWLDAATGNAYMANTVTIGNSLRVGNTANIGNSLTIGNNLTVGANATIGGNLTIGGLTTNGNLNPNVVTNSSIASGVDGGKLTAGSITATQISAAYVYAGNIVSTNATLNNINSPGYWMAYQTGDARFGGNVSVGDNLTVGNLITASSLNANTVSYNNIVSGTVPPPIGGTTYLPTALSLTSAASYDWDYTGGFITGYYKTLSYVTLPVTTSMAALGSGNQLKFQTSFSCNINASSIQTGSSGPIFYLFYNDTYYGGSGVIYAYPQSGTPAPSGASANGSYLFPSAGQPRILITSGSSYTGGLQLAYTFPAPVASGSYTHLVAGSTIVLGVGMFNSTNPSLLGTINMTNMAFNVILQ